jgi:general stress protein YciG
MFPDVGNNQSRRKQVMAENSDQDEGDSQDPGEGQPRRGRGFAGMDAERQRQISAEGGRAAHRKGTAHEFDSEEAREAGRKGGQASGGSRRRRSGSHNNGESDSADSDGEARSASGGNGVETADASEDARS